MAFVMIFVMNNIILWQILSSFIICVTDFMQLDYVCGRFSDLLLHVLQILCAKTLFVGHLMADFFIKYKKCYQLNISIGIFG